jgi:hypothetical protein
MRECLKRKALRHILAAKLYEFHRLLLAQFSRGAEDILLRAELSSMRCPACGAQMILPEASQPLICKIRITFSRARHAVCRISPETTFP